MGLLRAFACIPKDRKRLTLDGFWVIISTKIFLGGSLAPASRALAATVLDPGSNPEVTALLGV